MKKKLVFFFFVSTVSFDTDRKIKGKHQVLYSSTLVYVHSFIEVKLFVLNVVVVVVFLVLIERKHNGMELSFIVLNIYAKIFGIAVFCVFVLLNIRTDHVYVSVCVLIHRKSSSSVCVCVCCVVFLCSCFSSNQLVMYAVY